MGAVYSIGARLIDSDGNAELKRIQILDDSITIAQNIECKGNVVCDGNVAIGGYLSADEISVSGKANLNPTSGGSIKLPNTLDFNELRMTQFKVQAEHSAQPSVEINNSRTTVRRNLALTADKLIVDAEKINFESQTVLENDIIPSFLAEHSLVGSVWLIYALPTNTGVSFDAGWPVGTKLSYTSSNIWDISGTCTDGVVRLATVRLYECGFSLYSRSSTQGDVMVQRTTTPLNNTNATEFVLLTPLHVFVHPGSSTSYGGVGLVIKTGAQNE